MPPDERESQLSPPLVPADEGEPSPARSRIGLPPRAVIEAARRREPAAREAFFDAYFAHVYALACRLLGDRIPAEDLTQEVFIKVHRSIDSLDPDRDPWPWIATIAHNACRDLWRSGSHRMARRSEPLEGSSARGDRFASRDGNPEGHALGQERERLVRDAVERLPDTLRQLVLLYDYAGLSHPEVAELLGIEHAAVRKRYSRALAALGRILDETLGR